MGITTAITGPANDQNYLLSLNVCLNEVKIGQKKITTQDDR